MWQGKSPCRSTYAHNFFLRNLLAILGNMRILIKGAAVVPKPEEGVLSADVVVEGKRFAGVFPTGEAGGEFDRVIKGEGKLLVPGFVNAHTHLPMTLFRGLAEDLALREWLEERIWPAERKLTPEVVYWFALLGLVEMIRTGTTAFADMYFFMEEVGKAVEEAGLRALLSYGIIAPTPDRIEPELKKAEAFAREWNGAAEGRIRCALSPHAPYTCGPEVWKEAVRLAKELKLPLHTHLCETRHEVEAHREAYGKGPVQWLEELGAFAVPVIAAHCVWVTEKDIDILAAHNVSVAHCPSSNLKLASGIAPVWAMVKGGVNVAIGTDGAASNNTLDMVREMRLAALLAKVRAEDPRAMPAPEALKSATQRGAAALGWAKDLGAIEEGHLADCVLLDLEAAHFAPGHDPLADLVYTACGADVEMVMVGGEILMEGRELQTLDEEKIVARCRELARKFR